MAECDFRIPVSESASEVYAKAYQAITKRGGTFTGDTSRGNFEISTPVGKVSGEYEMADKEIIISITHKPFFVGCGMIESELSKYLAGSSQSSPSV